MRLNCGANVRFHLACASVCKHLLLEARQRCRDFSAFLRHRAVTDSGEVPESDAAVDTGRDVAIAVASQMNLYRCDH